MIEKEKSSNNMNQLTLQWQEWGQVKTYTIQALLITNHPETFRIGRDPAQCDLVLADERISRLHIEIFFLPDWQRFYLRNLKPQNPPCIDGGYLIQGEVALNRDNVITLGQTELKIIDITITNGVNLPVIPPTVIATETVEKVARTSSGQLTEPLKSLTSQPATSLQCSNCEAIWPQNMRNSSCPRCGYFLVDAKSVVVPESE